MNQTTTDQIDNGDLQYIHILQKQVESFDFEKLVEETLAKSAKICEERVEAKKAMATEKFYKEAYDNLLKMECSPSHINGKDAEQQQKAVEKFLKEAYDNLLHMFDGVSETPYHVFNLKP